MTEKFREEGRRFAEFLKTVSREDRDRIHKEQHEDSLKQIAEFKAAFSVGRCYLCDHDLTWFDRKHPCLHWFLRPSGFKKGDLPAITQHYGVLQIQSYLRWVGTSEGFARNINDLEGDDPENDIIALTIRYKEFEWSISCHTSDYIGHANSRHARNPHYHFQMRLNGRPFINYNDFHLPLSKSDIIHLEAMRSDPNFLKARWTGGHGMQDILTDDTLELIINAPQEGNRNDDEAPFKIDTFIMADEGSTFSGEDIYNLIQEAKEKGVTLASLASKIPNATATVFVSPGPGVVDEAPRAGGRGKGDKSG